MEKMTVVKTAKAMQLLGAKYARIYADARRIYLYGELGAGKTTLVRGFLQGLGYKNLVKSPTYTLVELYEIKRQRICHFDLYRLTDPNELEVLGARDYFTPTTICLVEWSERAVGILPQPDLKISITITNNGREVLVTTASPIL